MYSKVAFALIASLALASALPAIVGEGNQGGPGKILPVNEEGELGTVAGSLLGGGNLDDLHNLLGVLGPNPVGLGLLGNSTDIPSFLNDFLERIPKDVLDQVTDLLSNNNLPINELISQLNEILPGNVVQDLNTVTGLVSQLLRAISEVLSNLPIVLDDLTAIVNDKDQTVEQQTQAIDALKTQYPVEVKTIFYIASQLAQDLQGGAVLTVPETPQVPV